MPNPDVPVKFKIIDVAQWSPPLSSLARYFRPLPPSFFLSRLALVDHSCPSFLFGIIIDHIHLSLLLNHIASR
jgi:hypothetical protein